MRPSTLVALLFAGLVQAAPLPQQHAEASMPAAVPPTAHTTSSSANEEYMIPKLIHRFANAINTFEHQFASTTTTDKAPIVVKRSEPVAGQTEAQPEFVTLAKRQPKWPGFIVDIAQKIGGAISNSILGMLGSA
jgi:hypothetical protein